MTLRQEYARPRDRAIARHPDQSAQAAAPAHTTPAGAYHRRPACGLRRWIPVCRAVAAGSGAEPVPVGVLWVTRRRSCVVRPLAASDGGTSRDGAPAGPATPKPAQPGNALKERAMHPTQHSHNRQDPTRRPETGATAAPGPSLGSADLAHRRHLEKMVSWTGRERLRCLWYRLRLTVAEMNYATRRTVEVQAPWITGDRPR